MAEFSGDLYKQRVSSVLIQRLKCDKQLQVAENLINQNGLQWSSPNSSDVHIIGPNKDVLEFAIECLESLLDKNRNPLCSLEYGSTRFVFKGTLGDTIINLEQILKDKCLSVRVYQMAYFNDVYVSCSLNDYSKIRKTIDQIRYSTSSSTDSSSVLDKNVVEGKSQYSGYPGSPSTTPLFHFQHSNFQYSFKTKDIQVYVYKASITDVTGINAIVNAADEYLCHESGVAYAICEAAGYLVKQQCSQHLSKYGRIPTGQNCVTIPGNLKHLETIIHAVGPHWDDYSDKKQWAMALHETIINVLITANTQRLQKIALPPISAGIFKVPKDLCAQMYVKAIMDYSRDVKPNNVTEIHFVDIKDDILKAIREAHENWKKSPELLDFKNALGYAPPLGGAKARTPSFSDRQGQECSLKPVDDAKVHIRNEQLPKNTVISVTTSGEKDIEINKLEKRLRDLEAKKNEIIKEKRKKELEDKIRQAEEELRGLSAGTKQEQSNKTTPPLSSLSVERDREQIELELKLIELKEKKLSVLKERNKQELKEKIKQLEEDSSTSEAVPSKDIQEMVKRCLFCTDVLRNPKKLGCGHEFCSKCFYQASNFQEGCPVCGIQVGDDDELSSDALHSWYNSSDFIENS